MLFKLENLRVARKHQRDETIFWVYKERMKKIFSQKSSSREIVSKFDGEKHFFAVLSTHVPVHILSVYNDGKKKWKE